MDIFFENSKSTLCPITECKIIAKGCVDEAKNVKVGPGPQWMISGNQQNPSGW